MPGHHIWGRQSRNSFNHLSSPQQGASYGVDFLKLQLESLGWEPRRLLNLTGQSWQQRIIRLEKSVCPGSETLNFPAWSSRKVSWVACGMLKKDLFLLSADAIWFLLWAPAQPLPSVETMQDAEDRQNPQILPVSSNGTLGWWCWMGVGGKVKETMPI